MKNFFRPVIPLLVLGCVAFAAPPQAQPAGVPASAKALHNKACAAFGDKDYARATALFKSAAEAGDARSSRKLGVMYEYGVEVPPNPSEALKWYRLAAEQGDADSAADVGEFYHEGRGVPVDFIEAVRWLRIASDRGCARAQSNLGVMYERGEGVPKDPAMAVEYYRRAAEQGNNIARRNLGQRYFSGLGVPQNYAESAKWYRLAADQGDGISMIRLGMLQAEWTELPQDFLGCLRWVAKGACAGAPLLSCVAGLMAAAGVGDPVSLYLVAVMGILLAGLLSLVARGAWRALRGRPHDIGANTTPGNRPILRRLKNLIGDEERTLPGSAVILDATGYLCALAALVWPPFAWVSLMTALLNFYRGRLAAALAQLLSAVTMALTGIALIDATVTSRSGISHTGMVLSAEAVAGRAQEARLTLNCVTLTLCGILATVAWRFRRDRRPLRMAGVNVTAVRAVWLGLPVLLFVFYWLCIGTWRVLHPNG